MRRGFTSTLLVFTSCLLAACGGADHGSGSAALTHGADPNSWSVPEQVRVTNLELDLTVDFEAK